MSNHNIIPRKMRARHIETGAWETLHLDDIGWSYWGQPPATCYVDDGPDGGEQIDFDDYDSFEAA
jgi:hypothetical protein